MIKDGFSQETLTDERTTQSITALPISPSISPSGGPINNGSTVSLTATGCNGTVNWYANNTTTVILATGTTYTTPALVNNDTSPDNWIEYLVYNSCTICGIESLRNYATFRIYNELHYPTFTSTPSCSGQTTTITSHGCSNGVVQWYDSYIGGNLLHTGLTYTTPILNYVSGGNNKREYYASCKIGPHPSGRWPFYLMIFKQPPIPSASSASIACNASATLTVTGCNTGSPDNFKVAWYSDPVSLLSVSSATTFITPKLNASTTYYVACQNTCNSERVPVPVTVACTPFGPPVISANKNNIYSGEGINLTATGCSNSINWSDGGTGSSRLNVIFNSNLILTATCSQGCIVSNKSDPIAIVVHPKPILLITNPATVTLPNTVNITSPDITTGSTFPSGTVLSYYTNSERTIILGNPSAVAISGTYYIKAITTNGCIDFKPVNVVVNVIDCNMPLVLGSTDNYSSGTYLKKTNETITATNIIAGNANVTYRSNKSITMNNGFKVNNGAIFKTEIAGCN